MSVLMLPGAIVGGKAMVTDESDQCCRKKGEKVLVFHIIRPGCATYLKVVCQGLAFGRKRRLHSIFLLFKERLASPALSKTCSLVFQSPIIVLPPALSGQAARS